MKKSVLIVILIVIVSNMLNAAGYEETMRENVKKLNQTQSTAELVELANQFERIANKESKEWLPGYYAAYSYLSVLFFDRGLSNEQKHFYLDQAQKQVDKTMLINDKESEVFVLQGFIYQLRITDPSEGYKYSTLSNEALAKAEKLNPNNPRGCYLKGLNLYYTPENYGGGPKVARPLLEKAAALFEQSKNSETLLPKWGQMHNQSMLDQMK
jgi:hypothetical protein